MEEVVLHCMVSQTVILYTDEAFVRIVISAQRLLFGDCVRKERVGGEIDATNVFHSLFCF